MAKSAPKIDDPELIELLNDALRSGAMGLADSCRFMRATHGLSQTEFAEKVGVALKVVKDIESGTGNPTLSSLMRIAQFDGMRIGLLQGPATVRLGTKRIVRERSEERQRILQSIKEGKPQRRRTAPLGREFKVGLPKLS